MSGATDVKETRGSMKETTIMRRFVRRLVKPLLSLSGSGVAISAALAAAAMLVAPSAQAQEIQLTGPLVGQPAVRHERLYREGKFEIAPAVAFTLLDEYRRTIFVGGRLQYNITDWFGFGVWGAFGAGQLDTDLTTKIDGTSANPGAPRSIETAVNINHSGQDGKGYAPFTDQVAKWNWIIAPQVQLTPFRGKLSIFEKAFVDTDAYFHGGVALNGLQERENCGDGGKDPSCISPSSFTLASRVAVAPTFGLGLHFYFANFMSLGVEYRAVPFSWNRAGFNSALGANGLPTNTITSADHTFKFNQMIVIEVGFGLPPKTPVSD
jgi:hypothetical protein